MKYVNAIRQTSNAAITRHKSKLFSSAVGFCVCSALFSEAGGKMITHIYKKLCNMFITLLLLKRDDLNR